GFLTEDAAVAAKELELLAQAPGQRDIATVLPERADTLGLAVMQQQEVAHGVEVRFEDPVVAVDIGSREITIRKEPEEHGNAALDQVDRCGLERLEKARGESQRDHVSVPGRPAAPRLEAQRHRLAQGAAGKVV